MKWITVKAKDQRRACHMATALTITLGTFLAGVTGAHAKTLRVDDDGLQDRKAKYRSIQAAVDAAQPGDVIKVAPGLYPGTPEKYNSALSIRKPGLRLKGAQSGNHDTSRMTFTPDPTKESIIVMSPNALESVGLQASNVTIGGFFFLNGRIIVTTLLGKPPISGFRFENNVVSIKKFTTHGQAYPGIFLQDLTSSRISNNIIFTPSGSRVPIFGITTNGFLSDVSITGNKFYNIVNQMLINGPHVFYDPENNRGLDATAPRRFNIKIPKIVLQPTQSKRAGNP